LRRLSVARLLASPELTSLFVLIVLMAVFQAMSGDMFTNGEISGVAVNMATVGTIAVGVTLLMISGEFDLSVETTAALAGIVMAELVVNDHLNVWLATVAALALSATIGLLNGVLTVIFRIPSFIATLGMFYILGAVNFVITSGYAIDLPSQTSAFGILGGPLGSSPFSAPFLWMAGVAIVGGLVLGGATFGNWIYAAGSRGGRSAAMIGVPVRNVKMVNFVVCSTLAGLAGVTGAAQFGSVSSGFASGDSLIAIVAAVVGGTSLFGGRGSIHGTIIGAALVSVLSTGLVLVGAPGSWYTGIIGLLLIVAVIFNVRLERIGRMLTAVRKGNGR